MKKDLGSKKKTSDTSDDFWLLVEHPQVLNSRYGDVLMRNAPKRKACRICGFPEIYADGLCGICYRRLRAKKKGSHK